MTEPTLSNSDAVRIIENEGLGYAVRHYTSGSAFKDPRTAALWNAADRALHDLVQYLQSVTYEDISE